MGRRYYRQPSRSGQYRRRSTPRRRRVSTPRWLYVPLIVIIGGLLFFVFVSSLPGGW